MQSPYNKVKLAKINFAIDKALAYEVPPKPEHEQQRIQRKGSQTLSVKEPKGSYQAAKARFAPRHEPSLRFSPPHNGARPATAFRCADFFCGIGGFHEAARNLDLDIVFACDIDEQVQRAYFNNYGLQPMGDITLIAPDDVPDHDLLFAGFPCQPFSIIGQRRGFSDPRGVLFFELLRFVESKQPRGIVLENVKQLSTFDKGKVLRSIEDELDGLGYTVESRVLNALDFGLPQKRERTIIVATKRPFQQFPWPTETVEMMPLKDILESDPDPKHYVSDQIRHKRAAAHKAAVTPAIWHENKGGNVSSHEWSCALRAGASYNYLLVDGERRLTPREQLRLQGFPDTWEIVCSDSETRKQTGNAVPVPMVQAVIERVVNHIG